MHLKGNMHKYVYVQGPCISCLPKGTYIHLCIYTFMHITIYMHTYILFFYKGNIYFKQIPMIAVTPGSQPRTQTQAKRKRAHGYDQYLSCDDHMMDLEDFPIVLAYNGLHHICPTALLSKDKLQERKVINFVEYVSCALYTFEELEIPPGMEQLKIVVQNLAQQLDVAKHLLRTDEADQLGPEEGGGSLPLSIGHTTMAHPHLLPNVDPSKLVIPLQSELEPEAEQHPEQPEVINLISPER